MLDALEQALQERRPFADSGLVFHFDPGSLCYIERLAEASIEPSVGSVGDSYEIALAETVFGLFKTELVHRHGPWGLFEAVEYPPLEWVGWFNHRWLLEPFDRISPTEAEARYYAQPEVQALVARPKSAGLQKAWSGSVAAVGELRVLHAELRGRVWQAIRVGVIILKHIWRLIISDIVSAKRPLASFGLQTGRLQFIM